MNHDKEVKIWFQMWEQMTELESILWDRYYEDFLDLILEQEDGKNFKDHTQDEEYPI